jgi:hypothetical protein
MTTEKKTVKQDLVERAVAHLKAYQQYDGHFDDYKLGIVTRRLVSKMGTAFVKNEIVIFNPRVDILPLSSDRFHNVWSSSNKIDTTVNVQHVREIRDRPISYYQAAIIKLTDCDAIESMVVEGYMRDTYHTLDSIDRATFNRAAKKALKDVRLDRDTAAASLDITPIRNEEDEAQALFEKETAIIERFTRASTEHDLASKALDEHFLPLMHALADKGDIDGAEKILRKIPADSITKVFGMDLLRQAKLKLNTQPATTL